VDALDVLKVCLRRWYVAVPVVLLSVAAGLGLAHQQKPTYTAFASYALVYHNPGTSPQGREPQEKNPLAPEGARLLGEALIADFMSGASQATFGGVGHSGTAPGEAKDGTSYSVTLPDYSSTYMIQTWGTDPEGLRIVVDSVLSAAPVRAALIQDRAGAPKPSHSKVFVTGQTQVTQLPATSGLKLVIALLGVGIMAGSALSLVIDRLLRSRKSRSAVPAPQVPTLLDEAAPAQEADDSPQIPKVTVLGDGSAKPSENKWEPILAADANPQLDDNTSVNLAQVSNDDAERGPADLVEEVGPGQAREESRVNHTDAEQRHELKAKPLTEDPTEPHVADHMNYESEPDNGFWPLLEQKREFETEGAAEHHTRDRQPTH
jgi:hypothetical protein